LAAPAGARRGQLWDRLLFLLVLVLAFLAASFVVRNSDFWFHLATGRLLAAGKLSFGADPFAYTTGGAYWASPWLFDLALYGLHGLLGGAGLVVLKALLVAVLAGLLLSVRRSAEAAWLPIVCTTLAVLASSPRLLVQPACLSYFLFGLTFWLLWRAESATPQAAEIGGRRLRLSGALLLVIALWVNVDAWFLLGPLLVALFWLGERLQGQRVTPGWLVPAGLAACLLSPHTYHVFALPPELALVTWTSGLRHDPRFGALFASPWQPAYLRAAAGLNAAALAYFVLLVLGVVSFLLHRPALRSWRLVVWLPFALLASWQARTIPFFAVVAAPITALNGQDFLADRLRPASAVPRASLALAGRALLTLALLALIVLAWPGWLAGAGHEARHVAWGVQPDPSLQRAAEALQRWRRQGLLDADERVFNLSPEVAYYGAWFCPGERFFFDHRYGLFGESAGEYERVCRALELGPNAQPKERGKDWREVLRDHGVGIVVLYDREPQRLFAFLNRLADDPRHWTLLEVAGQAVLFGWNEARPLGAFARQAFDAERLAFGPQDDRARRELPPAPGQGPEHLPRPGSWQRLLFPPAPPTWESSAATTYLHYFYDSEAREQRQELMHRPAVRCSVAACAASLAGLPALRAAVPLVGFQVVASRNLLGPRRVSSFLVRDQLGPFFDHLVERSPALPLLAVRAARRAVAANPADANAWFRLGLAYHLLRDTTCERSNQGLLPPLAELRSVQIATAMEQAVQLDPDLLAAHEELAYLYGGGNALDKALEHRRAVLRLSRQAGPGTGETAEEFAHRLELLQRDVAKVEEMVRERRDRYATGSRALKGDRSAQARLALKLGLARQAADEVLLPFPADLLGPSGRKLELDLLLTLGRPADVRTILRDEPAVAGKRGLSYHDLPPPRGADGKPLYPLPYHWPAYEWLDVLQASALGDYDQARLALRAIRAGRRIGHDLLRQQLRNLEHGDRQLLAGLFSGPPAFLPAYAAQGLVRLAEQKAALRVGERTLRAQQADLLVLEGLLALEQGATDEARAAFTAAQGLAAQPTAVPFAGGPIAGGYLRKMGRGLGKRPR
jgi:hypothetical protein